MTFALKHICTTRCVMLCGEGVGWGEGETRDVLSVFDAEHASVRAGNRSGV